LYVSKHKIDINFTNTMQSPVMQCTSMIFALIAYLFLTTVLIWCYISEPPPVKAVHNPFAIERPHATPSMLERQGSFRGFNALNQASPFKRQMSLRISDLPSTMERVRSQSLEGSDLRAPPRPTGQCFIKIIVVVSF
jgi:hypothetical protein